MSDSKLFLRISFFALSSFGFIDCVNADLTEKQLKEIWEKGIEAGQRNKREDISSAQFSLEVARDRFPDPSKPEYKEPKPSRLQNKRDRDRANKAAKKKADQEYEEKLELWEQRVAKNAKKRNAGVTAAEQKLETLKNKIIWMPPEVILSKIDSVGFLSHTAIPELGRFRVVQFRRMVDDGDLALFSLDPADNLVTIIHGFNTENLVNSGFYVCSKPVLVEKPFGPYKYPKLRILTDKETLQVYDYLGKNGFKLNPPTAQDSDLASMKSDTK